MLYEVNLPSLSPTMEEGKIVKWIKKEKDPILSGEVLFEVETDKATMEYESPEDGYIAKIISKEGETANVNQLVAIISDDLTFTQEDINNFLKNNNSDNKTQKPEPRRIITKKIGRNEPCPCGSGKKYKQCHGS